MQGMTRRRFLAIAAGGASAAALGACSSQGGGAEEEGDAAGALAATQRVVVQGFAWGPAVTATILSFDEEIDVSALSPDDFVVIETKEAFDWASMASDHVTAEAKRTVSEVYACEEDGERAEGASKHLRLELAYGPDEGSPFCYDFYGWVNTWCDPYELDVRLSRGATLATAAGEEASEVNVAPSIAFDEAFIADLVPFDTTGTFEGSDGHRLTYAYFEPVSAASGEKLPLVIWLHGAGEGGTDPRIAILGNEVTALAKEGFQQAMGGAAYVLAPQTETFWLQWNDSDPDGWQSNPGTPSVFTQTLKELIDQFVAEHDDIDPDRVIIGGCSNGGYMTMNMLFSYPDYFAAAYPICEAYLDSGITDEQLESIKDVPMWFVYAKNDQTVVPENYEVPTLARLATLGVSQLHTSIFDDVHDTTGLYKGSDGEPYQYQGHFSWTYFFQNQCADDATGQNMWEWLGQQGR